MDFNIDQGICTDHSSDELGISARVLSLERRAWHFSTSSDVEEILELLKSIWRILGIAETIHCTCYAWLLFRQFVITGEQMMMQYVIEQLKKYH
ncbi:protein unc-13 homolog isoform X2 [Solanum pennellii]|uniref:Protein unc-13 homolog isoform X2 n=1 Tax=Solanum pennellii TaxID=28526 RepID=A0ABM1VC27_SOLPN|nr:protein unc-13 homolog isoform X2 [Solanum pennellii]